MNRRHFLRASGVLLALPALQSFLPRIARAAGATAAPKRFVGINQSLGFHGPHLFPTMPGADYAMTPYLRLIERHRADLTVISGLSHPGVSGGHRAEKSFLSGAPAPASASHRPTVSLDQLIGARMGDASRLPCLALRTQMDQGNAMSVDLRGQPIASAEDPARVFARLFVVGGQDDRERVVASLKHDGSLLDHVLDDARSLRRRAGTADRERLDEYFTALRGVEKRLQREQWWAEQPKPAVDYTLPAPLPHESDVLARTRLMLDLTALALQTDSTRSVSLKIFGNSAKPAIPGVTEGYHNLSHHGLDPDKIEQLALIENEVMRAYGAFLDRLAQTRDADGSRLLDHTTVLLGSNLGNASSHDTRNLPVLLAGGGFRHGRYLAFEPDTAPPLCNLFVSILHAMGLPEERFGTSTGALSGV